MTNNECKFSVVYQDKDFVGTNKDFEQFALLYSKTFAGVNNGEKEEKTSVFANLYDDSFSKYVRISFDKRSIIRKCSARNGIKSNQVALGNRTIKELGISDVANNRVIIEPANFIVYYLENSDKYVKFTAWSGLVAFVLTLVSSIITILSLFV